MKMWYGAAWGSPTALFCFFSWQMYLVCLFAVCFMCACVLSFCELFVDFSLVYLLLLVSLPFIFVLISHDLMDVRPGMLQIQLLSYHGRDWVLGNRFHTLLTSLFWKRFWLGCRLYFIPCLPIIFLSVIHHIKRINREGPESRDEWCLLRERKLLGMQSGSTASTVWSTGWFLQASV